MILWFDNWYWERLSSDPGNPVRSLNISAIAVLHIPDIPPFPGHRAYEEISLGLDSLISELHKEVKMIINRCVGIIAEPIDDTWIRVPLDFQRQKMRSLQWLPASRYPGCFQTKISSIVALLI